MVLNNGNVYVHEVAMEKGLQAIKVVKQKLKGCMILGVEFETEEGKITPENAEKPIVSCFLDNVIGIHMYRVDLSISNPTLELTK